MYLKILEDCDDRNIISNDLLVQACLLFDEFQYDQEQTRIISEVYQQVIKRGHLLSQLQISQIDHAFTRIQNISMLRFLPQVKKDIKERMKGTSVNEVIVEEMGLTKEEARFINYNADLERFTLN